MLGAMGAAKSTSALITDGENRLAGIVTEQDVTRRIALRCRGDESVADVMSAPVRAVYADDYLYTAIARMRRYRWRHMPVTDRDARPLGVIDLNTALAVAAEQTVHLIERISHEGTLDGLREVKAAEVEVAGELLADNVPAPEIQGLLTDINRDIHRRIIDARIAGMEAEGWGKPPVDFAAIIMGSGGRGENFLYPDQDNGFILADYPDEEHNRIDAWFRELAERMCRDLDAVGFPWCKGYVMAVNPLWRKTISQWRQQLAVWGRKHSFVAVRLSDIFFDFQPLYGRVDMAADLRRAVVDVLRRSPGFLREIHSHTGDQAVALGWFGRFITEKEKPEHRGEINLKHTGTLPLVQNIRMMALREGVVETPTLVRIDKLREKEILGTDEADYLRGAYRHITFLLLRQQIADFKAGLSVGNYVHPDALSERERDILKDSFHAIEALRKRMHSEMTADVF
jgi:signal-transduction protein with cAMP-binding, CBS, and nucleotidyltransferase domain